MAQSSGAGGRDEWRSAHLDSYALQGLFLYESLWGFIVLVKNHAHGSDESKGLVLMLLTWWCARMHLRTYFHMPYTMFAYR